MVWLQSNTLSFFGLGMRISHIVAAMRLQDREIVDYKGRPLAETSNTSAKQHSSISRPIGTLAIQTQNFEHGPYHIR